jgi:hypothetical protein
VIRGAAALGVLWIAGTAHADAIKPRPPIPAPPPSPPDASASAQAEDANFDEDAPHHGFQLAVAVGPAQQIGFQIDKSSGVGGGVSLRLGARANRWLSLLFEFDATSFLISTTHSETGPDGKLTETTEVLTNSSALSAIGGKVNIRDAVWVRAGVGAAAFSRAKSGSVAEHLYSGLGGDVGAGVEIMRRDRIALSFELTLIGAKYREGFVGGGFFALGLAYD